MKILVCGGRLYADRNKVFQTLDELLPTTELGFQPPYTRIITGGAGKTYQSGGRMVTVGADLLAAEWAIINQVIYREYKPIHSIDGPWPGAGPRRNIRMFNFEMPDMLLAFPGGNGTASMIGIAEKAIQCGAKCEIKLIF